jgi:sec-independent protein translocase protein TatA
MRIGGLGAPELILIVLAIVLIFGASKLGDIGGALGKSVREFKKQTKDVDAEATEQKQDTVTASAGQPAPAATAPAEKPAPVGIGDYRPPDTTTR